MLVAPSMRWNLPLLSTAVPRGNVSPPKLPSFDCNDSGPQGSAVSRRPCRSLTARSLDAVRFCQPLEPPRRQNVAPSGLIASIPVPVLLDGDEVLRAAVQQAVARHFDRVEVRMQPAVHIEIHLDHADDVLDPHRAVDVRREEVLAELLLQGIEQLVERLLDV